ncbi:hypothetical protein CHCC14809_3580 [Bacillus licheniformis]|uniref:DUF4352 domain-containing protein n=1 Tax=Bacillus licheniformis TaxID=1402 RepID=A0A8B5Y6V1_BACLI|nr:MULTISPECIES: DUF4352 domain-containing protein [Bacillus]AUZ30152.1 DUF4352 domain-containing protein [Bacillus licheniformis]AYC51043.1 DUF4352 domain-containing protein [Bacillus licheniformis]EQM28621.1 hypothetical protein N399_07815 [Bacillus licheniformis CG-B52]MDE1367477.1 DUF4352 domain-containing protein [Bacillus licheniformis]MDE1374970.1 DUF4352 domain-containing protein [Bacillus licheniformis]
MGKEKTKKPIYKKWWFWLIIVIIIGAAASNGGNSEQASSTNKEKSTENKTTETKQDTKKEETNPKIGDDVKVGDMNYKVNGKKTADQVGPSALPQKASDKYLVIDVTLKNNGNDKVTVDASFFKLKRGEKTYEADSAASMSANQSEDGNIDNSFFLQNLNPDSKISGKVVFDVAPEVANAKDLQLQVQTGAWGTETGIIDLK